MKKPKLFALALALATLALPLAAIGAQEQEKAQEQPTPQSRIVTRVFPVKYGDANRIAELIKIFPVANVHSDPVLGVISVSGSAETVVEAGQAIAKLDIPPQPRKSIDLTAYLLVASKQSSDGGSIPGELQDVATQLKSALGFQHYRLLDTLLLRMTDKSGGHLEGVVPWGSGEPQHAEYDFSVSQSSLESEGTTSTIFLRGLQFTVRFGMASKIGTDVEVHEGQKVVVGKTTFDSPDTALILVLTAKVS